MCMNFMDKTHIYNEESGFKASGGEQLDDNLKLVLNKEKKESKQNLNLDYASIICNFFILDKPLTDKN